MFYDDFCKTETQQEIFKAILELSKTQKYIAIQELNCPNITDEELIQTIDYFDKYGLFTHLQRDYENRPYFFSIR